MKPFVTQCKEADGSCLLRFVLKANAGFSLVSALLMLIAAKPFAVAMGAVRAMDLTVAGVSLTVYAAALFATARRQRISASSAWPFIILDAIWVVGSGFFIATAPLTTVGKWTVVVVGGLVLMFAIAQFIGARRLRKPDGELRSTETSQARREVLN